MAITTLDQAMAGVQIPKPIMKAGITMSAVGTLRGWTPWYVAGSPGAGAAPSSGINGGAFAGTVAGAIPRNNPGAGSAYLHSLMLQTAQSGMWWLVDRLWGNSGMSATSTGAQAIAGSAPGRDADNASLGALVLCGVEWSATGGAGTPTVTLTYTDQSGGTGNTGTLTGVTTPPVGTVEFFTLAAGDTGVRTPTSFIQSATRTSGTYHVMLYRVIAMVAAEAGKPGVIDVLTGGRPIIHDNTVPQLIFFPSATTAISPVGGYIETHG